jgi:hypothetical protein
MRFNRVPRAALVVTALCVPSLAASSPPSPAPGVVSGTITLATKNDRGLAQIPAGAVIDVLVQCLGGNPNAQHFDNCGTSAIVVPANVTTVSYRVSGLRTGPLIVSATAHALNAGPHHWTAQLTAPAQGSNLAITTAAPELAADISANGAYVPIDATADGTVPLGDERATIFLHRAVPGGPLPSVLPEGLTLVAYSANDPARKPIASATPGPIGKNGIGVPLAGYELDGLPLGTPLIVSVIEPSTAMPALVFSHVGLNDKPLGPACAITLSAGDREDAGCDFRAIPATQ